jgi:hypothetical protein
LSSHAYVDFYFLAVIYAGLGDKDEAFRLLEKGYHQRSAGMAYLAVDPFWDRVRSDPRYADLLRRMGLPLPPIRPKGLLQSLNHKSYEKPALPESGLQFGPFAQVHKRRRRSHGQFEKGLGGRVSLCRCQ